MASDTQNISSSSQSYLDSMMALQNQGEQNSLQKSALDTENQRISGLANSETTFLSSLSQNKISY